ncbi:PDC sensor domain-containing protein [Azospirillum sp. B2RO_4]|uniref:PDC sensor domain-containing protein n=1 Tax=Azospirillum sp. B2RO_4 TaxID=3027796 RepID=UPI003DA8D919
MTQTRFWIAGCAISLLWAGTISMASAADPALEGSVRKAVSPQAQSWLSDPTVVGAVKSQNAKHAGIAQSKIDEMDNQWKAAAKAGGANPAFDAVSSNAVSKQLKQVVADSKGRIVEILLMDDHGLNVGQTAGTSDYWQGDEPKWQKIFTGNADLYMTDPEKDDKSGAMLTEASVPVLDPAGKQKIGVAMIVLDTAKLGQ